MQKSYNLLLLARLEGYNFICVRSDASNVIESYISVHEWNSTAIYKQAASKLLRGKSNLCLTTAMCCCCQNKNMHYSGYSNSVS